VSDLLEGVDENTPRSVLIAKLRTAAEQLFRKQDERVGRLQEIEERIRREWAPTDVQVTQVIATSSNDEWRQAVDFLDNFEELLPIALVRVHDGARMGLGDE